MENLIKLAPLLLLFCAFMVCMFLIDRKSLNIKSKTVGDGQHGSASFATPKEIDEAFKRIRYEPQVWRGNHVKDLPQGIIIGCNMMQLGKKKTVTAIVDEGDVHALMIGAVGVGKTAKFLYPNLEYCCASGMSFVTTDTKGDLLRSYAPIAKKYYGYDISVLDLRNPTQSDGFNMLHMVNHYMDEYLQTDSLVAKAKAEKYAKIISKTIMNSGSFDSANAGQNAFFYDSAEGLITAVILVIAEFCSPYALVLEQGKQKQKVLEERKKEIAEMRKDCVTKNIDFLPKVQAASLQKEVEAEILFQPKENQTEEKGKERHIISVFKLIQDLLGPSEVKGKSQFKLLMEKLPEEHKARWLSGAALNSADQAMASVLSTALSRLNAFLDSEIEQLLCFETKIDTEKFCKNKSAVFLIMPEKDDSKYFLISLAVSRNAFHCR